MSKIKDKITLGTGTLYIDGQDVGYLGGNVVCTTEIEAKDFTAGTRNVLVKRTVTGLKRSLKASLAQLDVATLKLALGIGERRQIEGFSLLSFGGNWTLDVLNRVKFVHEKDDGKKVVVYFHKAQVEPGSSELSFGNDDYILQDVTLTAIEDTDHPDSPFGYIAEGEIDDNVDFTSLDSEGGGQDNQGGDPPGEQQEQPSGNITHITEAVTDESVTGTLDNGAYVYELEHNGLLADPAPVVKSSDGNTTYTAGTDYTIDLTSGVITTLADTTIGAGDTLSVSYTYETGSSGSSEEQ